jgi:serine/threonine protein kinase
MAVKNTDDTVSVNGKEYTLGTRLGGGTEGSVFEVREDSRLVVKLINDSKMNDSEKLEVLNRLKWLKDKIGNSELKHKLAVPRAIIDEDLGYFMIKANEHQKLETYLSYPKDEEEFSQWLKDEYLLKKRFQIIAFMFNALENIHIHGLIFTDLSPNNIMVHKDKNNLVFIDTDNMRKRDDPYTGVLGTDGYMAPEIYHFVDTRLAEKLEEKNIKIENNMISAANKISTDSDIFSAAIIAFELLTLQHPFVGDKAEYGTAEEETESRHCKTNYILHRNGSNQCSTNPFIGLFEKNQIVTDEVSKLFYKTFVDGKNQPRLRPTAFEFCDSFNKALDLVIKCPHCGVDILYRGEVQNNCWYCDNQIPEQVSLKIFDSYAEKDRASLISKLTNSNYSSEAIAGKNNFELSKIVLPVNEIKYLNLKHFEKSNNNSPALFALTLTDDMNKMVRIQVNAQVNNPITANSLLIHRQNKSVTPINKAKEFSCNEYDICFEISDSRVGKIKTLGCFYKGGKEW